MNLENCMAWHGGILGQLLYAVKPSERPSRTIKVWNKLALSSLDIGHAGCHRLPYEPSGDFIVLSPHLTIRPHQVLQFYFTSFGFIIKSCLLLLYICIHCYILVCTCCIRLEHTLKFETQLHN